MIIRCKESNREEVLTYVKQDVVMNLFIIGDIETYGFDSQFQTVFMDREYDNIKTVYLVYRRNLVIGSAQGIVDQGFVEKLVKEYGLIDINGDYKIIKQLNLGDFKLEKCKIAMLESLDKKIDSPAVELEIGDLEAMVTDCQRIFNRKIDLEQEKDNFEKGTSRYYGCKVGGRLVSGARTSAHCDWAAMIIGVYALEQYRNQGYGLATVYRLCHDFLEQGKKLCLFYNDPFAARLYHRLGFKDHGDYGLLRLK
ncbi:MAG: GNAT family N-acetyltransferase [Erysipelotrichaceae bacterium]|nr:GNAT family N-acetyltransferase [Erysipelotrichaceae bacterium]